MKKNVMKKAHSGTIIEMVIAFFFVVLALCMLIISTVSMANARNKNADFSIVRQSNLSQIGEYFLRAVEEGSDFPSDCDDANILNYTWIDTEAEKFFSECGEKYGFTFDSYVWVDEAGFFSFMKAKASYRKLVVKQGTTTVMTIIVRESKGNSEDDLRRNKVKPIYEVLDWSVNDVSSVDSASFRSTKSTDGRTLLSRLFTLIGELISRIR